MTDTPKAHHVTVRPFWYQTTSGIQQAAQLNLRGNWIADVFSPYTPVIVTHEIRDGKVCLVITEKQYGSEPDAR